MVTIVVDGREPRVMPELLAELGANVRIERLATADYRLSDECLVERKHVVDLHNTLMQGRLWPQLGRLRRGVRIPYLLIEGPDLRGPVEPNAIRGALLAIGDLGITVLRSVDRTDSAAWLYRLAHRRQCGTAARTRPAYAQRPRAPDDSVPEAMLSTVPGISRVTARRLLGGFGSISAIAAASPTALQRVPGVGPKRLSALLEALGVQ